MMANTGEANESYMFQRVLGFTYRKETNFNSRYRVTATTSVLSCAFPSPTQDHSLVIFGRRPLLIAVWTDVRVLP